MTVYTASTIVSTRIDQVFDLVADVELYPEFVPLWRDARIYHREGSAYLTEQSVGIGRVVRRFRTRTELSPPHRIHVSSNDPLFREFFIRWDFDPVGTGCRISVALAWEVESTTLQRSIEHVLPQVVQTIVAAFEQRLAKRVD